MAADKRSDAVVTTGTTCSWFYCLTQERNQVFVDQQLLIFADGPHQINETDFTCSDA